jgi:hypothetical protein
MWLARVVRRLFGPIIGFSFAIIVFGTSVFGNYIVTLFLPMITIFNFHLKWRALMDRAISFWMVIPMVSWFYQMLPIYSLFNIYFLNASHIPSSSPGIGLGSSPIYGPGSIMTLTLLLILALTLTLAHALAQFKSRDWVYVRYRCQVFFTKVAKNFW